MNITNQASRQSMRELLQDEIGKCRNLVTKLNDSGKTWSTTISALMMVDVEAAEKAIEERDDSAMFRCLRSLRINNTSNY